MAKLIGGGVYKNGIQKFVLVYLHSNKWCMLHIVRHQIETMSCLMFQHNNKGKFIFSERQLKIQFNSDKWILLDGRLRIEKIDPTFRMVEYTIGGELKEFNPLE